MQMGAPRHVSKRPPAPGLKEARRFPRQKGKKRQRQGAQPAPKGVPPPPGPLWKKKKPSPLPRTGVPEIPPFASVVMDDWVAGNRRPSASVNADPSR